MENNPERRLMAYCVEKVGFSAAVLADAKSTSQIASGSTNASLGRGEALLQFANILSGRLFYQNRPVG